MLARAQTPESQAIQPKIVLQTLPYGGVEVAAWSPNDRFIVTAVSLTRTVLIWDVERAVIVDRLTLPGDNQGGAISTRRLTKIVFSEDGSFATIYGEAVYAKIGSAQSDPVQLTYSLDMYSREIQPLGGGGVPRRRGIGIASQAAAEIRNNVAVANTPRLEEVGRAAIALEVLFENSSAMPVEEAEAILPPLPMSNDGKRRLKRDKLGLIIEQDGMEPVQLKGERNLRFNDAQLSTDGAMLAMAQEVQFDDETNKNVSKIDLFNTQTGQFAHSIDLEGNYEQIQWIFDDAFIATQSTSANDRTSTESWAQGAPAPATGINAATGTVEWQLEARCYLTAAALGGVYGAGLANCRANAGKDFGLQTLNLETETWQPFGKHKLAKGMVIENLSVSPDGVLVAISTRSAAGEVELVAMLADSGEILDRMIVTDGGFVSKLTMFSDGTAFVSANGKTGIWNSLAEDDAAWLETPLPSVITTMAETNGEVIAVAGLTDDYVGLWDVMNDRILPPIEFSNVISGGFLKDSPVFWAFSPLEGLRFWNSADWSPVLSTYFFPDQGFVTATPDGLYDTNLGPDAHYFRWLVPDRPFQSLSAQTFMRDYFKPGLAEQISICSYFEDCDTAIERPSRPIAELNRVLPLVQITDVKQGATPDEAIVSIEVTEGFDPEAPVGKQRSGVFNPRLFRDFRFTIDARKSEFFLDQDIMSWRDANRMDDEDEAPGDGKYHFEATLYLPTAAGSEEQFISAYAFNEDRIKSDTAHFVYTRPPMEPRQPRAFVISIGIDNYHEQSRLNLNYAVKDAALMGNSLAAIPGYATHRLILAADSEKRTRVTGDTIRIVLGVLSGTISKEEAAAELAPKGINIEALDSVAPDDVVIITFSGHGWTKSGDDFYLLPSDAVWRDPYGDPNIESMISSSELTMWLRNINAADIALIIDACHSGAAVTDGRFRPGPLGDAGLGQLAYDKGIRILAATQADDVALEDANLKHGLLSFALAGKDEGLTRNDGMLDLDDDKAISLSEWLAYPTWRMLSFDKDERVTGDEQPVEETSGFSFPERKPAAEKKVQVPSLFDFTVPSKVLLKAVAP